MFTAPYMRLRHRRYQIYHIITRKLHTSFGHSYAFSRLYSLPFLYYEFEVFLSRRLYPETSATVAIMSRQALSSSSFTYGWTYDVFLSFRGEDTRYGFTGYLYNAMREKGVRTFMDVEELRKGEEITPALLNAIQESRIAIIVFSTNYAYSTYCLEELVQILDCMKGKGRLVWPIFYQVDPSDVRYQKRSYGEALAKHEERFSNNKEKLQKWRSALTEAANLSGWHYNHGYEYEFIGEIIEKVWRKINRCPLHVADYPIGLQCRVKEVTSLLNVRFDEGTYMVGIYGIGGIGKTTIACAVYNFIADQFESQCFLADIRENSMKHGLVYLQETLLFEMVGEKNIMLGNIKKGITMIKSRLHRKKVLLILDDVDKVEQLQAIAGKLDWFGSGSRIIITTRDKHLLQVHGVERTYEMQGLNHEEALELFRWNAFKSNEVDPSYKDVLERAVLYSNGLPLALEIIGSNFFSKPMDEWKSALDSYDRIPDKSIQDILRKSYDDLKENEKEIFLDMACFFKGYSLSDVETILLDGRGFPPEYGVGVLMDKSLIKIDQNGLVRMHDLIEHMGREIVRQESPKEPGKRSRLWSSEDILNVLEEDMGTDKIEAIILYLPKTKEVCWNGSELKKMKNLKILIIEGAHFSKGPEHLPRSLRVLKWRGYSSPSLPASYDPRKLVSLDLSMSYFKMTEQFKKFESLAELVLIGCNFLKEVTDLSGALNLRELYLYGCKNLVKVHDSIGFLDKLEWLTVDECTNLKILPCNITLPSLQHMSLRNCSSLRSFPNIVGQMEHIREVDISGTAIEELPFSFRNLIELESILLSGCSMLHQVLISIFMLPKLERLAAESCASHLNLILSNGEEQERVSLSVSSSIRYVILGNCSFSDDFLTAVFPCLPNLEFLFLICSTFTILPACISECRFLRSLVLDDCSFLEKIKGIPPNLKYLSAVNCTSLTYQSQSILLSQALHDGGGTDFCLPGLRIPEWFDHCSRGQNLSFWFREKFPSIALCVVGVLDKSVRFPISRFNLLINGIQRLHFHLSAQSAFEIEHIILFDLQLKSYKGEMQRIYIEDGWNHAEISYMEPCNRDFPYTSRVEKGIIKWMGVHVYKQKTSMDNFRFSNPKPSKRTFEYLLNSNKSLGLNCYSLQEIEASEALDTQQQQVQRGCCYGVSVSQSLWKEISSIKAPQKLKMLMWNICEDALPTYEYLFRRKLVDSPLCPICEREPETIEHVFLKCAWTRPLWFGSDFHWSVDVDSVQSFPVWVFQKLKKVKRVYPNANQAYSLTLSICWAIWKGRNEFVLEDQPVNPLSALLNMS